MAKVFADDVSLEYNGTDPYIAFLGITVYDEGGNNNGFLDPGETADLTSTLKNIGGVDFTALTTTLYTDDPFIMISDNSGYFGSLPIDSIKENTGDRYTVTANPSAPEGHAALCRITITDGGFVDTVETILYVGKIHYYLWNPDPTPAPGQNMHSILQSIGYSGNYGTDLAVDLNIYQALLVTLGVYPNEHIITSGSADATAIVDFIQQGGRVYMEGTCWYIDPIYFGGHSFDSLFGLTGLNYYYNAMGPMTGQTGTFTTGMYFTYGGEMMYNDYVNPAGTGYTIFNDTDNGYHIAIANDASTYRTVGSCFELGLLNDATPPSTRSALIDSIMQFFGIPLTGVKEHTQPDTPRRMELTSVFPNPCKGDLAVSFAIVRTTPVSITVHDVAGRRIATLARGDHAPGNYAVTWTGCDDAGLRVPAGVYFVRFEVDGSSDARKVIVLQ